MNNNTSVRKFLHEVNIFLQVVGRRGTYTSFRCNAQNYCHYLKDCFLCVSCVIKLLLLEIFLKQYSIIKSNVSKYCVLLQFTGYNLCKLELSNISVVLWMHSFSFLQYITQLWYDYHTSNILFIYEVVLFSLNQFIIQITSFCYLTNCHETIFMPCSDLVNEISQLFKLTNINSL